LLQDDNVNINNSEINGNKVFMFFSFKVHIP
jgi:hypothetical protein